MSNNLSPNQDILPEIPVIKNATLLPTNTLSQEDWIGLNSMEPVSQGGEEDDVMRAHSHNVVQMVPIRSNFDNNS